MKIKLVLRSGEFTSFTSYYLESFWREYFDIDYYDSTRTYDRDSTIFVVWWQNANTEWPKQMRNDGYCVAVDNLWEEASDKTNYHWIENPWWFWYNESLWWSALELNQYCPNKQLLYTAFMPIRRVTTTRDIIVDKLGDLKQTMLWSYKNQSLSNDTQDLDQGQRYISPDWYNSTHSSLVVETAQSGPVFITEKTFKPLAFYHPFQVIAMPGVLAKLKEQGFETYSNLFDESYDAIEDLDQKLAVIINNLKEIKLIKYDSLTQNKMQHNHNRFFDTELVKQRIVTEIINPLIAYVQTSTQRNS
jgi:hypothetical protein